MFSIIAIAGKTSLIWAASSGWRSIYSRSGGRSPLRQRSRNSSANSMTIADLDSDCERSQLSPDRFSATGSSSGLVSGEWSVSSEDTYHVPLPTHHVPLPTHHVPLTTHQMIDCTTRLRQWPGGACYVIISPLAKPLSGSGGMGLFRDSEGS